MPHRETLERFVALVEANEHVAAVDAFYTEFSTMRENTNAARVGRNAHRAAEERVRDRALEMRSTCVHPIFVDGDHVVIRWMFHFTWKDGTETDLEELAYQRWEGEQIAEEQFFYDPLQMVPKQRAV